MSEWRKVRLGDVATEVTVGFVGSMAAQYRDSGVPFLRSLNVRPHRIELADVRYVDQTFHRRLAKSSLRPGDVVTVRTGKPGQSAVVPDWLTEANCSDLVITRPGPELDSRWLSYYLNWITDSHIAGHLVGAAQQHFNVRSAESIVLMLPPPPEQEAIAVILGALDDKISANGQTLRVADDLVRARFDNLGGDYIRLRDVAIHVREQVNPRAVLPTIPYVGLEHIPRRKMWLGDLAQAREATSAKSLFKAGDVLFGKLRPYFHKVASAACDGIASTDILVIRAKRTQHAGYVLAATSADDTIRTATAASQGTRMPRTSWADVGAAQVRWPGEAAAEAFSSQVTALAGLAAQLARESASLGRMRDQLLPLLMSGKVYVRDAERRVEDML